VISELEVSCLLVHQPSLHGHTSDEVKADQVDELVSLAKSGGVEVLEPFAGFGGFGGAFTVVGPTEAYYEQLLSEEDGFETLRLRHAVAKAFETAGRRALKSLVSEPPESLVDDSGGTTPRYNTSASPTCRWMDIESFSPEMQESQRST
jgi:hypothetical protein